MPANGEITPDQPLETMPEGLQVHFQAIHEALVAKYRDSINTTEQNKDLQNLLLARPILKSFVIFEGPPDLIVTFRILNYDIVDFVSRLSLLNVVELRNAAPNQPVTPKFDDQYRSDLLMAAAVAHIGETDFSDLTSLKEPASTEGGLKNRIDELNIRIHEVKAAFPRTLYREGQAALAAWTKYCDELVKPKQVGNFSEPLSERK